MSFFFIHAIGKVIWLHFEFTPCSTETNSYNIVRKKGINTSLYQFVSAETAIIVSNEREMVALWIDRQECGHCASLLNNSQLLCEQNLGKSNYLSVFECECGCLHFIFEIHHEIGYRTMILWWYWLLQNASILMVVDEWVHGVAHCFIQRESELHNFGLH